MTASLATETLSVLGKNWSLRKIKGMSFQYQLSDEKTGKSYSFQAKSLGGSVKCNGVSEFTFLCGEVLAPEPFMVFFCVGQQHIEQTPEIQARLYHKTGDFSRGPRIFRSLKLSRRFAMFGL